MPIGGHRLIVIRVCRSTLFLRFAYQLREGAKTFPYWCKQAQKLKPSAFLDPVEQAPAAQTAIVLGFFLRALRGKALKKPQ